MGELKEKIRPFFKGDIADDAETLALYSHDASIFEIYPQLAAFPKDVEDVKNLVKFAAREKARGMNVSLTARSAGTDMSGGSLTESILLVFNKYFTRIKSIDSNGRLATAEAGVFYRDFERETLRYGLILPSYPASREICAIGGMVNNNSGGEKSLVYGKTENYVERLRVVLADGNEYELKELAENELREKMEMSNFEGDLYRKMYELISKNYGLIQSAKPKVSKNSAGYYLWNIWDKEKNTFNLAKLLTGAQGTLGFLTEATFRLVPIKTHNRLAVIFLPNLDKLVDVVHAVLPLRPESFESYDDHTLKLAIKFFPSFAKQLGAKNIFSLALQFLPDIWMAVTGGITRLVLLAEFTSDNETELQQKINELEKYLRTLDVKFKITRTSQESKKYWAIRRESFNLLRQRIKDKHTAPFIDDIIVNPERLPEFLPQLNAILDQYKHLIYTIAGHVGDGNFHIIPLMNLASPEDRAIIPELSEKVYDLVFKFGGSITAEHNDGLIRSPYLRKMYGDKIYDLFEETKKIFDPLNIFNPGKKVGASLEYALNHISKK